MLANKINLKLIYPILFLFLVIGCTEEVDFSADLIVGEWQVSESFQVRKKWDGDEYSTKHIWRKRFIMEFLDNNCGYIFDEEGNRTNDFKWALQDNSRHNGHLLISIADTSFVQTFPIHNTEVFLISKFESDYIHTSRVESDRIDGELQIERQYFMTYTKE